MSVALSPPTTFTCATPATARSSPPIWLSASCVSCGTVRLVDVSASETIGKIVRVEPLDDRLEDLLRQLAADGRDRVANILRRLIDGLLEHERDDDLREAIGRRRVDLVDAADARQSILDAVDDLALDDVGRRAGVADADEDDRRLDVGELVGLQLVERGEPERDEREHRHDGDDRPLDGEVGNEHEVSLTPD